MSSQHPYSTLESFFIFNTIKRSNAKPIPFDAISKALKENDQLVKNRTPAYLARFGPEAIKELYLALLKEEARSRAFRKAGEVKVNGNGDMEKDDRKGKRREDEAEEEDLMNHVHYKYYLRYRDEAIASLRADEKMYLELKERLQQDERAQAETVEVKSPKSGPSIDNLLRHDGEEEASQPRPVHASTINSPPTKAVEATSQSINQPSSVPSPGSSQIDGEVPKIPPGEPLEPRQSLVEGRQMPIAYGKQPLPVPRPPPNDSQPFLPPPQPSGHKYSDIPPPLPDVHRRPSYPPPQHSPNLASRSPRLNQVPRPAVERPSSGSPIILPPPPGMARAGSLGSPLDSWVDNAAQQYRPSPTLPTAPPPQSPSKPRNAIQLPQPINFSQQQYPYLDSQTQQSPAFAPYNQNTPRAYPPSHQNQAPLAFQRPPSNAAIYGPPSQYPQTAPPYSYSNYGQGSPYYPQAPTQSLHQRPPSSARSVQHAPSTPAGALPSPPKLSPIDTGGSATRWKRTRQPLYERPGTPPSPGPDAISPVLAPSPSPDLPKFGRQTSQRGRGRPPRRGGSATQTDRGASTTSAAESVADTRLRSASTTSRVGDAQAVKHEPPATPAADDIATDSSTIPRLSHGRRNTLRALDSHTAPSGNNSEGTSLPKRKRGTEIQETPTASPTTPSFPHYLQPPPAFTRSAQVTGMRNFPRTVQTIMNDITSHKHAYMFQQPLSNRQAPGYKDIIHRPQDLKSIKAAVTNGGRALTAAVSDMIERAETPASSRTIGADQDAAAASPATVGNTPNAARNRGTPSFMSSATANVVTVPANPDLVPPKGIVNSAQFEKEVMRTFANAIMFNPDPKRGFPKSVLRRIGQRDGAGLKERHVPKGMGAKKLPKGRKGRRAENEAEGGSDDGQALAEESSDSDSEGHRDDESEGWLGNEKDRDVVHDTREMFAAIEEKMVQWRGAERAAETRSRFRGGDGGSGDEAEDIDTGAPQAPAEEESKVEAASSEIEKVSGVESRGRAAKRRRR